ncbi:MAG: hypothetical protein BWK80_46320 [Desulfobacteraceae bacterium IS3]|nr:MAG: hypothetical protein BWK80_46320 [Desulfobacteraceae bacterium IS3]
MNKSQFSYPYITSEQNILNGVPIIQGTRIPVRSVAGYYQTGMSADEILASLPHLTPSQVFSALAYYFDHQDEIDRDLKDASDTEYWKTRIHAGSERKNASAT